MAEREPTILLTGVNGQLGHQLRTALASLGNIVALNRTELNLSQADSILQALERHQPDIIVNPAAYTAVDRAESEVEQARSVNAAAPALLAQWAARRQALLLHYSTDYVFDGAGERPWREDDPVQPRSVYGQSKWEGEEAVRAAAPRHLILRTSWVFGAHGGNFLKTILRLAQERDNLRVVADQIGAPTSTALISEVTAALLRDYLRKPTDFAYGSYHLAAQGETSWHGYARFLVAEAEKLGFTLRLSPADITPIATADYPLPAPRPANSRLDCAKLQRTFGLALPRWESGVEQVLAELAAQPLQKDIQ
ncbi:MULTISPECIES: dTDP-4-dehydrorhamnose reductase [Chromobacterium]|uniref:dTDP-4-dehydrorhamnose reductase n=2 Tax=Chromobacterium TaxID=535 RepID=A0ABS3GGI4_9NEIS|nr:MULTISPECIES: dTDP-4-dehydrorhamnose reductase [Chromobacterium]AXT48550.1 dTDP-4-dehydrorhamnose reductase [Chromobacterium rhizoryzae]MBK0412937.1 dTDP-4-dehydrorhamnose reductase [Chromobacterium haemolyticum]MBO0414039.1 dTDP-4-dehydrorhamnose reductase [Chromobacterium haemolyticum]MBO0497299.1 dTDP-4-dehydrorhamnose reductase [Chromobacterium haemolyticum]QOD82529.1 dTDP-4-dehydrorhamnose reductase [Chromobacterium haemolyticum]